MFRQLVLEPVTDTALPAMTVLRSFAEQDNVKLLTAAGKTVCEFNKSFYPSDLILTFSNNKIILPYVIQTFTKKMLRLTNHGVLSWRGWWRTS